MAKQENLFDDLPVFVGAVSRHPLYGVWSSMKDRCINRNSPQFKNYGGRGIFVCNEWRNSSRAFVAWGIAAGWKPGLEIDRIDNDGPYSPANCRFVTRKVNMRNTRLARRDPFGVAMAEHAENIGITRAGFYARLSRGMSLNDAASVPRHAPAIRHFLSDGTPLPDAILASGVGKFLVYQRIRRGWSPDDAVSVPAHGKRPSDALLEPPE